MKYVYSFNEGNKNMRNTLGGKGANLAEMVNLGLPVPMGFTVSTDACIKYYDDNKTLSQEIINEIFQKLKELEQITNKQFGNIKNPLLLSVRSGARVSMPGMMDTVLNLGLNDEVAEGFAQITNNSWFVYDSYRRFIQMFADVVMNFDKTLFEGAFDEYKKQHNILKDQDLSVDNLKEIISIYKKTYQELANTPFPQDPNYQLIEAIKAVFRSWNNDRAITYRKINNIPNSWGTAVNIQQMVYGNLSDTSGTGVAFTRNPATGENKLYGEYLMNAQGEDVVAGIRTPQDISTLKDIMPECYNQFVDICKILEHHYKDMQDMEFTIENSKLYMLQTRNGKRTAKASLKIAVDLVKEGMITKEEALLKVDAIQLDQILHSTFKKEDLEKATLIGKGLPASPGSATGKIYFSAKDLLNAYNEEKGDYILVRDETSPEDIEAMTIAKGILTLRGGMTSHAAVVARGMGICCVSGCESLRIDYDKKILYTEDKIYKEEDMISIDGNSGYVYEGLIPLEGMDLTEDFKIFMSWADSVKRLKIRANADNTKDAMIAKEFGAEGIGLCRSEHMFFEEERLFNFRKMILARTEQERKEALDKILPYQIDDFYHLFKTMKDYSVTIRLLDPPLHEFLPKPNELSVLANSLNMDLEKLKAIINELKEVNPMMGHRGCRLAITYPSIAIMQTEAIITSAIKLEQEGIKVTPEIMIPLISDEKELIYLKNLIDKTATNLIVRNGSNIKYEVGTMIELPRAALIADRLANHASFFSFGTNDLTQMTYGFSRDDAAKFLNDYYEKHIFEVDPFKSVDKEGVFELMKIATTKGRKTKSDIKLGICGEHGGEVKSIELCEQLKLDYVSCSPYRIPIARLAAAQAVLNEIEIL